MLCDDYEYIIAAICCLCYFFFFKQKTAYEMRISDWSSDVCSSDLVTSRGEADEASGIACAPPATTTKSPARSRAGSHIGDRLFLAATFLAEIGRASCRERVCQYV